MVAIKTGYSKSTFLNSSFVLAFLIVVPIQQKKSSHFIFARDDSIASKSTTITSTLLLAIEISRLERTIML